MRNWCLQSALQCRSSPRRLAALRGNSTQFMLFLLTAIKEILEVVVTSEEDDTLLKNGDDKKLATFREFLQLRMVNRTSHLIPFLQFREPTREYYEALPRQYRRRVRCNTIGRARRAFRSCWMRSSLRTSLLTSPHISYFWKSYASLWIPPHSCRRLLESSHLKQSNSMVAKAACPDSVYLIKVIYLSSVYRTSSLFNCSSKEKRHVTSAITFVQNTGPSFTKKTTLKQELLQLLWLTMRSHY